MAVCINCSIILQSCHRPYEYVVVNLNPELLAIAEEWCGREVTENDQVCQECLNLIINEESNRTEFPNYRPRSPRYGHVSVCISCGLSLVRQTGRRHHRLSEGSIERSFIENHIFPRQVPDEAWACHRCWMHANRGGIPDEPMPVPQEVVVDEVSAPSSRSATLLSSESDAWPGEVPNIPQPPTIRLGNYRRTSDTSNSCFVPDCANIERHRIPKYLKRSILSHYKIYLTPRARVCQSHISVFNWDMLEEYEFLSDFSESHIVEMLELLSSAPARCVLNFENVENIPDNICHYWTGRSVVSFMALYNSVPQLGNLVKKSKTALGMFLVKLRTGESNARIASLFLLGIGTVSLYIRKVRNCLTQFYVPMRLGVNHISREIHSARNLLIPQGLFGTEDNNPIVICDGTYIYVQKSSNYLYQKKTYSLHKYRNLIKPFLMVTCDGYIIDAYGPYAATQSDADIIKNLFENAESPLRSYFMENDVFILDRGFRDAIGLLTSLGYSIHKPETLSVGERQLSTIKANKSRCVTLCRWVVEVVNGRFKRDFKIFRANYFNVASKNLMKDFRIAAALLNDFHPAITDHPDAQSILNRALERINTPNELADYVIEHRLNRYSANFINIDAQLPQLDVFPVMEMQDLILFALGIYQIKQARSYYGEHIRQNGTFIVEIDTNLQQHSNNNLLIRGRIRSRHVSNRQYFTYILLNVTAANWSERIAGYYCSCIVGKRTVGCCAHVMTMVWYLGWARHQDQPVLPPATFLDNILVRETDESE